MRNSCVCGAGSGLGAIAKSPGRVFRSIYKIIRLFRKKPDGHKNILRLNIIQIMRVTRALKNDRAAAVLLPKCNAFIIFPKTQSASLKLTALDGCWLFTKSRQTPRDSLTFTAVGAFLKKLLQPEPAAPSTTLPPTVCLSPRNFAHSFKPASMNTAVLQSPALQKLRNTR